MIAYKFLVWAVLIGSCIGGGWLGWWHMSKSLYLRDAGSEVFGEATISPALLMRRRIWRIVVTLVGAGAGVVLGWMALITLTRFQS